MQTERIAAAYELFVEIHADYTAKTFDQVQAELTPEQFEAHVRDLHHQYMAGHFSIGRFSELIGVPHWELWEILDMLGLPLYN